MKKLVSLTTFILVFLSAIGLSSLARAASDPVALLQSIADDMIAELKAKKATLQTNPGVVYSLANRLVVPHADVDEMARRVLPPNTWAQATSSQQARFKKEFIRLLVRTYASALAEYNDQTVKFYPVRGGYAGQSTVSVNSQIIRSDGPPISMSYRLVNKGGDWRLYDMVVEGVSMLGSFRSQFADQLSQGDMDKLISVLAAHNSGRES